MYKCINLEIEIIRQKVCIDPHYQKKKKIPWNVVLYLLQWLYSLKNNTGSLMVDHLLCCVSGGGPGSIPSCVKPNISNW